MSNLSGMAFASLYCQLEVGKMIELYNFTNLDGSFAADIYIDGHLWATTEDSDLAFRLWQAKKALIDLRFVKEVKSGQSN